MGRLNLDQNALRLWNSVTKQITCKAKFLVVPNLLTGTYSKALSTQTTHSPNVNVFMRYGPY